MHLTTKHQMNKFCKSELFSSQQFYDLCLTVLNWLVRAKKLVAQFCLCFVVNRLDASELRLLFKQVLYKNEPFTHKIFIQPGADGHISIMRPDVATFSIKLCIQCYLRRRRLLNLSAPLFELLNAVFAPNYARSASGVSVRLFSLTLICVSCHSLDDGSNGGFCTYWHIETSETA
jgi:hypothetical protein